MKSKEGDNLDEAKRQTLRREAAASLVLHARIFSVTRKKRVTF